MYTTVEGFIKDYQGEAATTQKLLDTLTDESLNQQVAPGYRTLGHLAWHLVHNDRGILHGAGLSFEAPSATDEPPVSAATIAQSYRATTEAILEAVRVQLTDAKLQENVNMFGQTWTISLTLYNYLKHEVHHRGQLTILMRQAGLAVTGAYGPAKQEWAYLGAPAPAY
ncbi:hypothetical protein FU659_30595 [Paenibacillus sp. N3.4]|nr:hypothetical protein FU659_30595 [Paenibacillus sp. N3.4]